MEIADVVIFIAEDKGSTLDEIRANFDSKSDIISELKEKYSTECLPLFFESIKDFESQIEERYKKTQKEGRLYLSIGILDLAYIDPKYDGISALPDAALSVLEEKIIPLFDDYHFRAILVTNIFNHCDEHIEDKEYAAYKEDFRSKKDRLEEQIVRAGSIYVHKIRGKKFGEGQITDAVVKKIKNKLRELIEEEIKYSDSSDSAYIKR